MEYNRKSRESRCSVLWLKIRETENVLNRTFVYNKEYVMLKKNKQTGYF